MADAEDLIRQMEVSDIGAIKSAATKLASIGENAADALIVALRSEKWQVRYGAVFAMQDIRDERAIAPMIEMLDADWSEIAVLAGSWLKRMGDAAVPALIEGLADERKRVRTGITDVLIMSETVDVAKRLLDAYPCPRLAIKECMAKIFGGVRGVEGIPFLIAQVAERDANVRNASVESLAALAQIAELDMEGVLSALRKAAEAMKKDRYSDVQNPDGWLLETYMKIARSAASRRNEDGGLLLDGKSLRLKKAPSMYRTVRRKRGIVDG